MQREIIKETRVAHFLRFFYHQYKRANTLQIISLISRVKNQWPSYTSSFSSEELSFSLNLKNQPFDLGPDRVSLSSGKSSERVGSVSYF